MVLLKLNMEALIIGLMLILEKLLKGKQEPEDILSKVTKNVIHVNI